MQRLLLVALAAVLSTTTCAPDANHSIISASHESSDACSGIISTTSVQILLPPGSVPLRKNAYTITDPSAVQQLVGFVSPRRDVGPISFDTPPYPQVKATFYEGSRNVGIFGSGSGVFYFQCGTARGTRYASATELAEFQRLIARPNTSQ